MVNILEIFRKPATGSTALRARFNELEAARPDIEAEISRLTQARADMLLDADDGKVRKVEAELADRRRDRDRLNAAAEELTRRIAEAEADEAKRALTAARDEADRKAKAAAAKIHDRYVSIGNELASMIADLTEADAEIERVNAALANADRAGERLQPVEPRVFPIPAVSLPEQYSVRTASLPPAPGFAGLGRHKNMADLDGLVIEMDAAE